MKSEALKDSVAKFIVAPLVGAWIEMQNKSDQRGRPSVAPLVGAWIEIRQYDKYRDKLEGRSSCRSVD